MLKRSLIPCALIALLGGGPEVLAQASGQAPAASQAQGSNPMVHFEGCLFTEAALTATTPITHPSGTYVLTHVKVISGAVSEEEATKTTYAVGKVEPEQLRSFFGKRVGVTGRVAAAPVRPNLEVVSIRDISGGCPVLPSLS